MAKTTKTTKTTKKTKKTKKINEKYNPSHVETLLDEADAVTARAEVILHDKEAGIAPVDGDSLHIDVQNMLERAEGAVSDREVKPNQGKFLVLHRRTQEELEAAYEQQAAIAHATVRVVNQTTHLMKAGLEAALGDLRRQTDRYTQDDDE